MLSERQKGWCSTTKALTKFLIVAIITVVIVVVPQAMALTAGREALIIANKSYAWSLPLKNPVHDAQLLQKTLEKLGFNVVVQIDIDRREMNRAISQFTQRLNATGANIGVFYYAGHGVQDSEENNYLIPLKARIETVEDVDVEGYPADKLMRQLEKSNVDVSLVFLDACRNQPYPPSVTSKSRGSHRGLAEMNVGIKNTLIMYSTAAGSEADDGDGMNSPFALAVKQALEKQGSRLQDIPIEITNAVNRSTRGGQIPFHQLQLNSTEIVINSTGNSNDSVAWEATRDCNTLTCYRAYLGDYPKGKNRRIAEAIIAKMLQKQKNNQVDERKPHPTPSQQPSKRQPPSQPQQPSQPPRPSQRPPESQPIDYSNIDYSHIANVAFYGMRLSNKQLRLLQDNADNPKAQAILSILYDDGLGVQQDEAKGFQLAKASAEAGEPLGMVRLSYCYRKGRGVEKNAEKSFSWINKAVNFKNIHAYRNMGHYYRWKDNPNYAKALAWYRRAVAGDDALAKAHLGWMYRDHVGVKQNYAKARELFKQSAEQGSRNGDFFLAYAYEKGQGVKKSWQKALKWYEKAAIKGHKNAQVKLAKAYEKGRGVPRNPINALLWYTKAANQGDRDSMKTVIAMYEKGIGVDTDYQQALNWYEKLADLEDVNAMRQSGLFYQYGRGTQKDYLKAKFWLEKAANAGDAIAMRKMGVLYRNGQGVARKDYFKAKMWFEKSAQAGDVDALVQIGLLHEKGFGVTQDYQRASALYRQALSRGSRYAKPRLDAIKHKIKWLQGFLNGLSCAAGSENGVWRARTQRALRRLIQANPEKLGTIEPTLTLSTLRALSRARPLRACPQ